MGIEIIHGKCEAILPTLEAESFHACVTDPPYHLTEIPHVPRGGYAKPRPDFKRSGRVRLAQPVVHVWTHPPRYLSLFFPSKLEVLHDRRPDRIRRRLDRRDVQHGIEPALGAALDRR